MKSGSSFQKTHRCNNMLTINDFRQSFNRAFSLSLTRQKLLLTFCILALCGLMVVFARAIASHAGQWIAMSLTFLPFFLCSGLLLSTGILLIRIYHDEIKSKETPFRDIVAKSWEIAIGASYFTIPIIMGYLLLWMLLGIFFLLQGIPGVGSFFTIILAFGPFLLNFGSLLLCVLCIAVLYFLTPILAFRGFNRIKVSQLLVYRLKGDVFSNILLAFIALLPLTICLIILSIAAIMTGTICYSCETDWHIPLQWFFIMIPFTALLTPAVVFFFSMSAEAHVLMVKDSRQSSSTPTP